MFCLPGCYQYFRNVRFDHLFTSLGAEINCKFSITMDMLTSGNCVISLYSHTYCGSLFSNFYALQSKSYNICLTLLLSIQSHYVMSILEEFILTTDIAYKRNELSEMLVCLVIFFTCLDFSVYRCSCLCGFTTSKILTLCTLVIH